MATDNPKDWDHGMDQILVDAVVRLSLLGNDFFFTSHVILENGLPNILLVLNLMIIWK